MFEYSPNSEFKRNAVEPVECLKAGWQSDPKNQYWLFFGMTAVGFLIGSLVPFGLLMGPMMCGLYLAFFQTRRGQPIEFGVLFKGFDYFGDSVVATLLHMIPLVVVFVPELYRLLRWAIAHHAEGGIRSRSFCHAHIFGYRCGVLVFPDCPPDTPLGRLHLRISADCGSAVIGC